MKSFIKSTWFFMLLAAAFFLLQPVSPLHAGFNEIMDQVLAEGELTYGSAAWLVLTGSGVLSEDTSVEDAVREMEQRMPKIPADRDRIVSLGEFAFFIMESWDIGGGLFYTLFPSPRYALRELRFLDIVQGQASSRMKISGERAVRILGRVIAWKEGT